MHIDYSALRTKQDQLNGNDAVARYRGYEAACKKHSQMINTIQQYLPGWVPPFYPAVNSK